MWKESVVESCLVARVGVIYQIFEKQMSQIVFLISQLPEHLQIKVKTVFSNPVHADYDNVLHFFHRSKFDRDMQHLPKH